MLKPKYFVLVWAVAAGSVAHGQILQVIAFRHDARNPSWSADGRILFERDGQVVVAGAKPSDDAVVTSGSSPQWHPSARFFAFAGKGRISFEDPDTKRVLSSFPAGREGDAARDLRFSRDGASFAWMEDGVARIRTGDAVGNLELPGGIKLTGIDDFGADGRELLVTAHAAASSDSRQTEIYACGISRAGCHALTGNSKQRQDFARLSPSGRNIVFASSETAWVPNAAIDYEADFWIAPFEGGGADKALRMTWFGEPANPRYDPARARVNAASWRADGRWLVATITEGPRQDHSRLVKIEFPGAE